MSFGGYYPAVGSELPISSTTRRSRSGSNSSTHSNHGSNGGNNQHLISSTIESNNQYQVTQQNVQNTYQSPYSTQVCQPKTSVPTIGLGLYTPNNTLNLNNDHNNNHLLGSGNSSDTNNVLMYDGFGSGSPSTYHKSIIPTPDQQSQQYQNFPNYTSIRPDDGGYSSGYDSPTGSASYLGGGFEQQSPHHQSSVLYHQANQYSQAQQRYYQTSHSRRNSNASETSLNIDTGISGNYSPGPASLSSAASSRRGSFSDTANSISGGISSSGFYSRKKTFRLSAATGDEATNSDADDDLDMKLGNNSSSPRRQRQRKLSKKPNSKDGILGSTHLGRVSGLLNDWDMLLPSGDPYEDEYGHNDDNGMTENERWKRKQLTRRGWESSRGQSIVVSILSMMAVIIRIWKLAIPAAVVSDEQHIGGYTNNYLSRKFFMDVHPPLGKMLYALVAYVRNFDGKFDFVAGKLYTWGVPYISMRMLSAACGILLVPISYLIIKKSGHSTLAAITCAVLVTFENALVTQSRLALLDSPMMLFMGYTILAWVNFYNYRNRPFTRGWWSWLLQTGIGLFLSSSVKWVGLFTVATIGLCVLKYLQESRTHLYLNTRDFSKQFIALSIFLILFPTILYMGLFAIDFQLLSYSGTGDSWVSPQFRMTLKGHGIQPVMADIAWKSKIRMRHGNSNGGWLHSMPGEYARPGTVEQAIQLVEWDDDLTCWQVEAADPVIWEDQAQKYIAREKDPKIQFDGYIHNGDNIRLRHCYTKVALSVSELTSTGSNKPYIRETRGMNWPKDPRPETVWRVELVVGAIPGLADDYGLRLDALDNDKDTSTAESKDPKERWHSIKGFRLYNEKMDCYLMSHKVFRNKYSPYQEVGCIQGNRQKSNTIFVVDHNINPNLPATTQSLSYQPLSFFQKFLEVNRVMWWTHRDFSSPYHADNYYQSGTTKKNRDESHPWSWPFLSRGLNYYVSKETNNYVYLMGNPLIWWAASATAFVYMGSCVSSIVGYIRNNENRMAKSERERFGLTPFYSISSGTFFAGWAIHYFPFFVMNRHLYIYHYLPAMYFSILLLVSRLDKTWQKWPKKIRYSAGFLFMAATIVSWYGLSPLAYGLDFSSRSKCETARSLGGWEFVCNRQNLALARPEAIPARIVVEDISEHNSHNPDEDYDHEHEHEHSSEEEESSHEHYDFIEDEEDDYDEYDEDHHNENGEEGHPEHDQAGPFVEAESDHYDHEHFYHPHGHAHGHGKGHGHGHEIHDPSKEKPHSHHHHQHSQQQQQQQQQKVVQEQQPSQDAIPQVNAIHRNRAEAMMAAAEIRSKGIAEKDKLLAEKAALEAKRKELEARLLAHEIELENQIQIEELERLKEQQSQKEDENINMS